MPKTTSPNQGYEEVYQTLSKEMSFGVGNDRHHRLLAEGDDNMFVVFKTKGKGQERQKVKHRQPPWSKEYQD